MSSLTQGAYEVLRGMVLSGQIRPGAKVRIRELGDRLEVSYGAVREALSRLTSEGFVTAEPQKGFRACAISASELRDLTASRLQIEAICLKRSIELGDIRWESAVLAAFHELSRTDELAGGGGVQRMEEAWSELHRSFHATLVSASDSEVMLRIRGQLDLQAERYRRLSVPLQVTRRDTNREHREIYEFAIRRDSRRAIECLSDHLNLTTKILLRSLNLENDGRSGHKPIRKAAQKVRSPISVAAQHQARRRS
jgi:DNA-binding GntR family transcriptional regulator